MKQINLFLGAVAVIIIASGISYADPVTKPHEFSPYTPAKAEEVNENFDVLYDKANQLDSQVCTGKTNKWITLNAESFHGRNIGGWDYFEDSQGRTYITQSDGVVTYELNITAPVQMPVGAVIQRLRLYAVDDSSVLDMLCFLKTSELPDGTFHNAAGVASSGSGTTGTIQTWEVPANEGYNTIDTPFYSTYVECSWLHVPQAANLWLYGVSIEYTEPATCQ